MQLLEISPHKCLVSCLELHLKAGLRPKSLCNSLPESYRTFLVHPEEGRTLSPSTTGAVMGIEMPVLGLSEDLSLPAISAVYQSWIAAEAEVIKQLSYPIFLLNPTSFTSHHLSFQQLKLWKEVNELHIITHFSWFLQLLLRQALLVLKDKCTHGCCSKENMQIHHIWQAP